VPAEILSKESLTLLWFLVLGVCDWFLPSRSFLVRNNYLVVPPLSLVSLSEVSVTHNQLWSENIKWKIPEINDP
jgi:hypothetical protein